MVRKQSVEDICVDAPVSMTHGLFCSGICLRAAMPEKATPRTVAAKWRSWRARAWCVLAAGVGAEDAYAGLSTTAGPGSPWVENKPKGHLAAAHLAAKWSAAVAGCP